MFIRRTMMNLQKLLEAQESSQLKQELELLWMTVVGAHRKLLKFILRWTMNSFNSRVLLIVTWLCQFSLTCVHAQHHPDHTKAPSGRVRISLDLSLYLMIIALVSAVAFMGLFLSLSLRYCWRSQAHHPPRLQTTPVVLNSCPHGVDPTVLDSFPILIYSIVKQHKIGKGVHECAVCLSEFRDCDTLMLLPKCDHVFHPDCIHTWLTFHVTCPVCRANLAGNPDPCGCGTTVVEIPTSPANAVTEPDPVNSNVNSSGHEPDHNGKGQQVVITVYPDEGSNIGSQGNIQDDVCTEPKDNCQSEKSSKSYNLQRSHSTGHSLVPIGNNMERYTLRSPVEIRKQLRRSASSDAVLLSEIISVPD